MATLGKAKISEGNEAQHRARRGIEQQRRGQDEQRQAKAETSEA